MRREGSGVKAVNTGVGFPGAIRAEGSGAVCGRFRRATPTGPLKGMGTETTGHGEKTPSFDAVNGVWEVGEREKKRGKRRRVRRHAGSLPCPLASRGRRQL